MLRVENCSVRGLLTRSAKADKFCSQAATGQGQRSKQDAPYIEGKSVLGLLVKSPWLCTKIRLRNAPGPRNSLNFARQRNRTTSSSTTSSESSDGSVGVTLNLNPALLAKRLQPIHSESKPSEKFDSILTENESGFNSETDAVFSHESSECPTPASSPDSFTFHELADLLQDNATRDSIETNDFQYSTELSQPSEITNNHQDDLPLHTAWNVTLQHKNKKDLKSPNGKISYPGYIQTLCGFWRAVHHLPFPTELVIKHRQELAFFRNDIQPTWESPANANGGFFRIVFDRSAYERKESRNVMVLNETWIELLMAMVGETIPHSEYLTGCAFKRRQAEDRIEIWTRDIISHGQVLREMEEFLIDFLARFGSVEYVTHEQNRQYFASFNKNTSIR